MNLSPDSLHNEGISEMGSRISLRSSDLDLSISIKKTADV